MSRIFEILHGKKNKNINIVKTIDICYEMETDLKQIPIDETDVIEKVKWIRMRLITSAARCICLGGLV